MTLRSLAPVLGGIAAVAIVGLALAAPAIAAAGWLMAFACVAAVVFGTVALLLIRALTGGRWGDLAGPALERAATFAPVLVVGFLVLLLSAPHLYAWVRAPSEAGPGVAALYLNPLFFAGRGIVFVAGMAALARILPRRAVAPLAAGLCLTGYCVAADLVSFDWLLSLDPHYTSSAFGAQIIVSQLVAGLAWAILATAARPDEGWPDLAALLLATLLGEAYLVLMTFVIHWYGDLPQQANWYLQRSTGGWLWLVVAGVAFGMVGPLLALLFAPLRQSPRALKGIAVAALGGVAAENVWLVAPAIGGASIPAAALAATAMVGLGLGALDLGARYRARVGASHGV